MKILLCNDSYPKAVERLNSLLPQDRVVSCAPDDVAGHIADIDVVIPSVAKIDADILRAGKFGFVQQLGVGLDSVDIPIATECGVWVARVPGAGSGNAESVAELAIMFMIALSRRLYEAKDNISKGIFFRPGGKALLGKTACIVGFGDIGTAIAERLQPFGMKMRAVRKHPEKPVPAGLSIEGSYGTNQLKDAFNSADFIILALPETAETKSIIDKETIAFMKPGVFLINVGRGGLINEKDLLAALDSGHIAGCGLDVFWDEPMDPNHAIFSRNVIGTPHIGGNTDASFMGVTAAMAENIKRFAAGQKPLHVVNSPATTRR